jgi:hypothetical protein
MLDNLVICLTKKNQHYNSYKMHALPKRSTTHQKIKLLQEEIAHAKTNVKQELKNNRLLNYRMCVIKYATKY